MNEEQMLALLLETFATEAQENLGRMEEAILQLERTPDDAELVRIVFRAAHSIKGDAACVGRAHVADCAHALEDLMQKIIDTGGELRGETTSLLLRAVDVLRQLAAGPGDVAERTPMIEELTRAAASLFTQASETLAPATPQRLDPAAPNGRRTLRVDITRLDRLLDLTGEIAVARSRLGAMIQRAESHEVILEAYRESDRLYGELQEIVSRTRMVQVGPMFRQFARTVRDVSTAHGKIVEMTLEGEDVEVDTSVVDQLRDPLTHLVRNAIDHGIEHPDDRAAAGKDVTGRLKLSASHDSGMVVIRLSDDGRGLDTQRIAARARALGLIGEGASPTDAELQRLVFEPGFSTAEKVTELSGRGLGMDIVRRKVESLRGRIEIASTPGAGTTFTIRLPLTLAILDGFAFRVAGETYIVPLDGVVECVELRRERTTGDTGTAGVLQLRDAPLPYVRLRHHFGAELLEREREYVVVIDHAGSLNGLAVDELIGEMQVVIKPLSQFCNGAASIAGSAVLGDGRVALVIDAPCILQEAIAAS